MSRCTISGCEREILAKGLCTMHYSRKRRTGKTGGPDPIIRASKSGYLDPWGYLRTREGGRDVMMHRLILEQYLGRRLERHETVHHINGDKVDNRLENLELWASGHPPGQRVLDLLEWADKIQRKYGPERRKLEDQQSRGT